ncbi:MAG: MmcQ/YjbR family DNA-binding protein [Parvularculaceae bacterium]|nr:MmcQ/YjbR family DNA-binding protein [Parvularculaceae bacterium]
MQSPGANGRNCGLATPALEKPMPSKRLLAAQEKLRRYGLTLPEAFEDHPWGHIALKVRKKAFVFLSGTEFHEGKLRITVKLPRSGEIVKETLPYVEAAGYGLGRSGWITARFAPKDRIDIAMLCDWIDQSYVAIAPKKLGALVAAHRRGES